MESLSHLIWRERGTYLAFVSSIFSLSVHHFCQERLYIRISTRLKSATILYKFRKLPFPRIEPSVSWHCTARLCSAGSTQSPHRCASPKAPRTNASDHPARTCNQSSAALQHGGPIGDDDTTEQRGPANQRPRYNTADQLATITRLSSAGQPISDHGSLA